MSLVIIILFSPLAEAAAAVVVVVVDSDTDHQKPTLDWDDEPMDHDTVELLLVSCGAELGYSIEDFQDPHVKKTILDCLKDKRVVSTKSRKDKLTRKWYIEYLVSFIHKPNDSSGRRRLGETVSQGTVIVVVVITAVVTLCVAGLLFYCYIRNFGVAGTQNDEKTLLRSSMGKNSTGGGSKKSEGKSGNIEEQMDEQVSVDTGPHLKAALDANVHPQAGRVQSSLRHTLKPRAARAESSLRPTRKMEISVLPSGGKTDSPVGGAESSPLQPPVNVGVSPVSSPAVAAVTATAAPISPATAPQTFSPVAAAPSTPNPPPQVATPPPPAPQTTQPPPVQTATQPPPVSQTATPPPPVPQTATQPPPPPPTGGGAPPPPPPKPGGNISGPGPPPPPRRLGASIRPPRRAGAGPDPAEASKARLKPFFWDKVMAKSDQQMVWDKIKSGSFQFNEEMIESLFGYQAPGKDNQDTKTAPAKEQQTHFVKIIDPKKAQNLSILLKALNVTTKEVTAALIEGNELPIEIVQTLLKMAPTSEEELKLRLYGGDLSRLGPAERFLKALVEIPFAFKRLESLLFMCTLQDEEDNIKESFETLEAACLELKKSRLFLKLLEAVLKTGNRMNVGTFRGCAKAFKLDTLLKLLDVKGIDGKTTLLHFVVQEIMRGEGIRAVRAAKEGNKTIPNIETKDLDPSNPETEEHYCRLGLEVVSGLSDELENVTKAAIIDADALTSSVSKLGSGLIKARESLNTDMKNLELQSDDAEGDEFWMILTAFVETAEKDVTWMQEQEKRIMALIKSTADYFHGNCGKDEGLRLFTVVRDFLIILERVVKEIQAAPIKPLKKKDLGGIDQKVVDLQLDQVGSGDTMPPLPPIPTQKAE
ncbi:uncharacterized protein LOC143545212 [Bidens hawaiensis]|uniref:uncharacterized protein LOC143545212 n=1 Tax=Bidens hawaiensis TaxID=980011 RepID=UPI00404AB212